MTVLFWPSGLAGAQTIRSDFQLTKLFCAIREGRFISYLGFKNQMINDQPMLVGELSNYSIQSDGSKKYISGILFTRISYSSSKVMGHTGDPSDIVGQFMLARLDTQFNGRWMYHYQRTSTDLVKAVFNCSYNDSNYDRRRSISNRH